MFVASMVTITGLAMVRKPVECAVGLGTLLLGWLAWHLSPGKRAPAGLP